MTTIAAIGILGGALALIIGLVQFLKARRIANAPFAPTGKVAQEGATVAAPNGAISVEGEVSCPQPLRSPVTQTPCLYWELRVEGSWKEGEQSKSKDYVRQKRAAQFSIDDGSGAVPVRADQGGDFAPMAMTFNETKKEGLFADLASLVGKGKPIQFGAYAFENPTASKADTFTCTEHVMKVPSRLFALGKHDGGAIVAPGFRSLLLSDKSRSEVLGSSAKAARLLSIGGAAALAVGSGLGVVAHHTQPKVAAQTASAALATSAVAAAVTPAAVAPDAAASEDDCNRAIDHLYAKVKLSSNKRRKLVFECQRDMTKANVDCVVAAQTIGQLQKCQPRRKGRRSRR